MLQKRLPTLVHWICLLACVGACTSSAGPEQEISGRQLYMQHCARCHGADGSGNPSVSGARDLSDSRFMNTLSDEHLRRTIRMGKPPNMPAFGNQFSEPSLSVLVAFIRQLSKAEEKDVREISPP